MWQNIIFIICINELHWIMKMKQMVCPFAWVKASAGGECWYSAATLLWSICRCKTFPQVMLYCETCPTQTWRNKVCMHNCRQSLFAITCCLLLEQVSEAANKYYVAFSVIFRVDFFKLSAVSFSNLDFEIMLRVVWWVFVWIIIRRRRKTAGPECAVKTESLFSYAGTWVVPQKHWRCQWEFIQLKWC